MFPDSVYQGFEQLRELDAFLTERFDGVTLKIHVNVILSPEKIVDLKTTFEMCHRRGRLELMEPFPWIEETVFNHPVYNGL